MARDRQGTGGVIALIGRALGRLRVDPPAARLRRPMTAPTDSDFEGPLTRQDGPMTQQDALLFALREDATRDHPGRTPSGPYGLAVPTASVSPALELPEHWPASAATADSLLPAAVTSPANEITTVTPTDDAAPPDLAYDPSPSVMQLPAPAIDPLALARLEGREALLRRIFVVLVGLMLIAGSWASFRSGAAAGNLAAADRLAMLSQRIGKAVQRAAAGQNEALAELRAARSRFSAITEALVQGGEVDDLRTTATSGAALEPLGVLRDAWTQADTRVVGLVSHWAPTGGGTVAAAAPIDVDAMTRTVVDGDAPALLVAAEALSTSYREEAVGARRWLLVVALMLVGAAVTVLLLVRNGRERELLRIAEGDARSSHQEAAILRLMNELAALAEGDLTQRATVSDDITGAIADSVNFTIEELSQLVARINVAAEQMASASTEANRISGDLLVASDSQSEQIQGASDSIVQMTRSIEAVSSGATRSADVARQSLMAAEQGALAVHNSIAGMNEIRGQIQDTAKRIKRLGESSQQIGEIVALISDITERTQVLALNAAIQAAAAGEAGRGFTVVAEEVQRLAERSAGATGQIATIVRTIQTDTQDAVAAMERSTQQVVEGARLSDAAGKALAEIGDVSRRLAEQIEAISMASLDQVRTANQVTASIENILAINRQTSDGTRLTVGSVGELAALADLLKESVSNFKLA